jgi:adenine/guanine phosphoribosyltransferase-like PRPP-binding protein
VRSADSPEGFVTSRFGVVLRAEHGEALDDLVRLALRRNPKRAHLLVSTVLGKHIPTDPRIVHEAGTRLGNAVAARLHDRPALVIGYAETATGLGHCVAEALGADCLHSTRREPTLARPVAGFEEAHSHATGHLLVPEDASVLTRPGPIVLVDDELSTGATALNTISELHRLHQRDRYVVAALVDVRTATDRERFGHAAAELGISIEVVSLGSGTVELPADLATRAGDFVASAPIGNDDHSGRTASVIDVQCAWPSTVRDGGRHGFTTEDQRAASDAATIQAQVIEPIGPRVLVLGTEELMYAPLLIALELALRPQLQVRYSTTTRSPVLALDEPGYPIRSRLAFRTSDGERFTYNVAGGGFDDIVVVVDTPDVTDLVDVLRSACTRVHVVRLPSYEPLPAPLRGPEFGSYATDEVAWLLTDLSDVALEAPVEEREEAVQSGGAHYAESLPIEYQPSAEYQDLFDAALDETAARLAHAVGVITELVLDRRARHPVLVSLARAGTPIGILMRRWAAWRHDLDLPHYAVSIVRGRGIDTTALRYLATYHDPAHIMFVDGWTGKGAIVRELASAVEQADPRFSAELAVLADTGSCSTLYGTREDYLIPSACLNSTVSGLVSRTVLNDRILAGGQFHGAKFYKELAPADVSGTFLDRVTAEFAAVAGNVDSAWPALRDSDRTPSWAGWAAVEAISEQWGIGNVNLVKPGVGETTRVLLRRVPWRVLVRPGSERELRHVFLLAEQRGVPIEEVPGLAYRCVGLIHPAYTRGAIGADGRTAT